MRKVGSLLSGPGFDRLLKETRRNASAFVFPIEQSERHLH
jgi:hypothetical protein